MRTTLTTLAAASALTLLVACGDPGGSSTTTTPSYATKLVYISTANGPYELVADPASSGGTLILDLVANTPATPLSGVSFSFNADTSKVAWTTPISTTGTAFNLGSSPQAVVTKVSGTELQGAVSQKGTASPVTPASSTVLAKITLTLKGQVAPGPITFTEDLSKCAYLDASGVHPVGFLIGQLSAQ